MTGTYDSAWKDKLLSWDGTAMTYDAIGNMLTRGGTTYTWTQGRRLSGVENGKSIKYLYDHTGARVKKTVDNTVTEYQWAGDLLLSEKTDGRIIWYCYDSQANLISVTIRGITYFYVRNVQGDIIALVNYMTQILLAMIVVANLVVLFTKASASAARLNEVFETQPSVCESTTENIEISESESTPKIEFDNVNFTYGTGDDELEDISFKIKRGQTVGLIGGTGCGKSTLVNLIPRFYDATQGTVSVDGRNVKDYPFLQLRSQIGIVPQQSILFKGTIRDNMKWQNENATDEDIIKALKIAQAYEFVSKLNKGLDSFVEQGGKNFSGGQRQRLCIARALTGSPKLLILDDSFSALDFATDAALRKALRENTKDMTVIIVTQRCSTIKNADLILVLDDGRLVGKGQHDELFESCETYREICLSQLNEEEAKR